MFEGCDLCSGEALGRGDQAHIGVVVQGVSSKFPFLSGNPPRARLPKLNLKACLCAHALEASCE